MQILEPAAELACRSVEHSVPSREQTKCSPRTPAVRVVLLALVLATSVAACSQSRHVRDRPGVTLSPLPPLSTIPPSTTVIVYPTYVVGEGDTFENIARRLGVTADELALFNGIVNRDRLEVGQVLEIPPSATTTVPRG